MGNGPHNDSRGGAAPRRIHGGASVAKRAWRLSQLVVAVACLAVLSAPACTATGSSVAAHNAASTTSAPTGDVGPLARPRVAEPDPNRAPYHREDWQPHGWADADGNSCNSRAEVLIHESVVGVKRGTRCKILAGEWQDPYTGRRTTSPADLQIDHLVALSDASSSGGWAWPAERKIAFANDLDDAWELNAVWGPENQRKSDYGPDGWLPPVTGFRCTYVVAYSRIKAHWNLTVTPAQWAAIERVWTSCGTARQ